jgi:hypothetical protein
MYSPTSPPFDISMPTMDSPLLSIPCRISRGSNTDSVESLTEDLKVSTGLNQFLMSRTQALVDHYHFKDAQLCDTRQILETLRVSICISLFLIIVLVFTHSCLAFLQGAHQDLSNQLDKAMVDLEKSRSRNNVLMRALDALSSCPLCHRLRSSRRCQVCRQSLQRRWNCATHASRRTSRETATSVSSMMCTEAPSGNSVVELSVIQA